MTRRWIGFVWAGVCLWLAGCVSTPETRIKANPALFASYPPAIQEEVRRGTIDVGFTEDMVRMALGEPSRIIARTTAAMQTRIWVYLDVRYTSRMEPVETGYWYEDRAGRSRWISDMGWVNVEYRHEYPALRIEFEGGRVKAIERLR